jgi:hypothetical protein
MWTRTSWRICALFGHPLHPDVNRGIRDAESIPHHGEGGPGILPENLQNPQICLVQLQSKDAVKIWKSGFI